MNKSILGCLALLLVGIATSGTVEAGRRHHRHHRHHHRHGYSGGAVAAGFFAGALAGSAFANVSYDYGYAPRRYYRPAPVYYTAPRYVYRPAPVVYSYPVYEPVCETVYYTW